METSKMSLQNLQNLHSTNCVRVVDVILYFCFSGNLLVFFLERFNLTEGLSKLSSCGGILAEVSGQVSVFHKVIVSFLYYYFIIIDI